QPRAPPIASAAARQSAARHLRNSMAGRGLRCAVEPPRTERSGHSGGDSRLLESGVVRTPLLLFALALAVRAVLVALFPDPAYPDSYYYVDVARAIAAGKGLNVDFVWIFA